MLQNASWLVTDRTSGTSQGAFAFNNVAVHVGDIPAHVAQNRERLQAAVGAPVVFTRAAHSNAVHYVAGPVPDVPGVDALISDHPQLGLAAQGADCAMLALVAGPWIAAIHCGWRGLVNGVVPATLRQLELSGAPLAQAQGHIGPAICGTCYTVDPDRARHVAAAVPRAVTDTPAGPGVDVRAGVLAQLHQRGIAATVDPRCTFEDPDLYSYRRDGLTGRQAIVVVRQAA